MPAQLIEIFAVGFQYDGDPVSGGTVEVYEAGTSTPAAVWYDRAKTEPTAGGVTSFTLDTQGRKIVYGDDVYKFIVKDSEGVTLETIDDAEYASIPEASTNTIVEGFNVKVVDIGTWNMDSTASVSVAHGLDWRKIRTVSAQILDDLAISLPTSNVGQVVYDLDYTNSGGTGVAGISWNFTHIILARHASPGFFDSVNFDSTAASRGWITICYVD